MTEETINQIQWSGYTWNVKSGYQGPGPNNWSANSSNVWSDKEGNLHLKVSKIGDSWYCSEIYSAQSFGYGEYIFQLCSRMDVMDKNMLLGLFTFMDNGLSSTPQESEIDIEFSNWNNEIFPNNSQYLFQHRLAGNDKNPNLVSPFRFKTELEGTCSTHKFTWARNRIFFQSYHGNYANIQSASLLINQYHFSDGRIPLENDEKVHINLWLYGADSPFNQQEAEIIVKSFTFRKVSADM